MSVKGSGDEAVLQRVAALYDIHGNLPALEAALAAGRLSIRDALAGLDTLVVDVDPEVPLNVNTPDDL